MKLAGDMGFGDLGMLEDRALRDSPLGKLEGGPLQVPGGVETPKGHSVHPIPSETIDHAIMRADVQSLRKKLDETRLALGCLLYTSDAADE